jgi:hypothetical protein
MGGNVACYGSVGVLGQLATLMGRLQRGGARAFNRKLGAGSRRNRSTTTPRCWLHGTQWASGSTSGSSSSSVRRKLGMVMLNRATELRRTLDGRTSGEHHPSSLPLGLRVFGKKTSTGGWGSAYCRWADRTEAETIGRLAAASTDSQDLRTHVAPDELSPFCFGYKEVVADI